MMKILFIVPALKNTGPILVAYDLVNEFIKHGHKCKVYYFDNINQLTFNCETKKISFSEKISFEEYDIVHTHGFRPQLFVFIHRPISCKTKFVTTMHNYVFEDFLYEYGKLKSVIYGFMQLHVCLRADKIITLSKDAMKYYAKYFPAKKLTYAYNTRCCDYTQELTTAEYTEVFEFRKDCKYLIGTCSPLIPRKGIDIVIRALQKLPHVKFFIIGNGVEKKRLSQLVESLNLSKRVYFAGHKPKGYRYMKHFDAFTISSYTEGFPLAMLEAAAYGTPIVASNLPVYDEVFEKDEISLFDITQPHDVVNAIIKALDNHESYSKKIKNKYESTYSPECFYQRHKDIYLQLLNKWRCHKQVDNLL